MSAGGDGAGLRHDNATIVAALVVSGRAVRKQITGIFHKLGLPAEGRGYRRVPAVPAYLDA